MVVWSPLSTRVRSLPIQLVCRWSMAGVSRPMTVKESVCCSLTTLKSAAAVPATRSNVPAAASVVRMFMRTSISRSGAISRRIARPW